MAYIGPEVVMPVASLIAGLAGAVLMFWRRLVALLRTAVARVRGGGDPAPKPAARRVERTPRGRRGGSVRR